MAPPPRARRPPRRPSRRRRGAVAYGRADNAGGSARRADQVPARRADRAGQGSAGADDAGSRHDPRCTGEGAAGGPRGRACSRAPAESHTSSDASAGDAAASDPAAGAPTRDAPSGGNPGRRARGAASGDDSTGGRPGRSARGAASREGPVQEQQQAQEEEERQEGARTRAGTTEPAGAGRAGASLRGLGGWPSTFGIRCEREQPAVRQFGGRPTDCHGCAFAVTSMVNLTVIQFVHPVDVAYDDSVISAVALGIGDHLFAACNNLFLHVLRALFLTLK